MHLAPSWIRWWHPSDLPSIIFPGMAKTSRPSSNALSQVIKLPDHILASATTIP